MTIIEYLDTLSTKGQLEQKYHDKMMEIILSIIDESNQLQVIRAQLINEYKIPNLISCYSPIQFLLDGGSIEYRPSEPALQDNPIPILNDINEIDIDVSYFQDAEIYKIVASYCNMNTSYRDCIYIHNLPKHINGTVVSELFYIELSDKGLEHLEYLLRYKYLKYLYGCVCSIIEEMRNNISMYEDCSKYISKYMKVQMKNNPKYDLNELLNN